MQKSSMLSVGIINLKHCKIIQAKLKMHVGLWTLPSDEEFRKMSNVFCFPRSPLEWNQKTTVGKGMGREELCVRVLGWCLSAHTPTLPGKAQKQPPPGKLTRPSWRVADIGITLNYHHKSASRCCLCSKMSQ